MAALDRLVIVSRKSPLAMTQTEYVKDMIEAAHAEVEVSIRSMQTHGDKVLDVALSKIGDKGLFTRELEACLLKGTVHMAVHSLKDLPTQLPEGLEIAAITKREEPRDALVVRPGLAKKVKSLHDLPDGSTIGTSSLRRVAQLKRLFPTFTFCDIRGSLHTRLAKLDAKDAVYDALILASAGLLRLQMQDRIQQIIPESIILPAVGQGALAIEVRDPELSKGEFDLSTYLNSVKDQNTMKCCLAERAFLRRLEGGCQVPIGGFAQLNNAEGRVELQGGVFSLDGSKSIIHQVTMKEDESSEALGIRLAEYMISHGAASILEQARKSSEASK